MELNKIKDNVLNKIWITRKCRINTADRLEKENTFYMFLSFYYSALIIILSIINLFYNSLNHSLSLISISLITTFIIIYYNSQNFKERSLNMKNIYLKLDTIYINLESNTSINQDHILKISNEYSNLLNSIENHNEYDFLKFKYGLKKSNEMSLNFIDKVIYYLIKIKIISWYIIIFFIPWGLYPLIYYIINLFKIKSVP